MRPDIVVKDYLKRDALWYGLGMVVATVVTGLFCLIVVILGANRIFNWLNATVHLNLGYHLLK